MGNLRRRLTSIAIRDTRCYSSAADVRQDDAGRGSTYNFVFVFHDSGRRTHQACLVNKFEFRFLKDCLTRFPMANLGGSFGTQRTLADEEPCGDSTGAQQTLAALWWASASSGTLDAKQREELVRPTNLVRTARVCSRSA